VKRRLLNVLTALSLLLCAAAVALWVRSYFRSDTVHHTRMTRGDAFADITFWTLDSARGSMAVRRDCNHLPRVGPATLRVTLWKWESHGATDRGYLGPVAAARPVVFLRRAGFEFYGARFDGADGGRSVQWRVTWPVWAAVALTDARPLGRLCRRVRRGRYGPGHCRGCGYDLRGNESGVCPECGRAVKRRTA
jgi:hypothetical protein